MPTWLMDWGAIVPANVASACGRVSCVQLFVPGLASSQQDHSGSQCCLAFVNSAARNQTEFSISLLAANSTSNLFVPVLCQKNGHTQTPKHQHGSNQSPRPHPRLERVRSRHVNDTEVIFVAFGQMAGQLVSVQHLMGRAAGHEYMNNYEHAFWCEGWSGHPAPPG